MSVETVKQKTIMTAVEACGGWAKKASNMYVNGIPDLVIKHPGVFPFSFEVEVKTLKALPVRMADRVKFAHPLTELQNLCLNAINSARGCAAWWVIYPMKIEDLIYIGLNKHDIPTKEEFLAKCFHRKIGPHGLAWSKAVTSLLEIQSRMVETRYPLPVRPS
jgi:hypothetical protein